jgi:hypothetical protein
MDDKEGRRGRRPGSWPASAQATLRPLQASSISTRDACSQLPGVTSVTTKIARMPYRMLSSPRSGRCRLLKAARLFGPGSVGYLSTPAWPAVVPTSSHARSPLTASRAVPGNAAVPLAPAVPGANPRTPVRSGPKSALRCVALSIAFPDFTVTSSFCATSRDSTPTRPLSDLAPHVLR